MFRRTQGDKRKSSPGDEVAPAADNSEFTVLPRAEWRSFIEAAYRSALGREVDPEALEFWLAQLDLGVSATTLLRELQASSEYSQRWFGFASGDEVTAALSSNAAMLSDSLQHTVLVDAARFEAAWRRLPDYPAYQVIGQPEYCEQHKQRFYELVNALAILCTGKQRPRVLEIGVSACSNLYAQLFPDLQLELADRPTDSDYPGFTRERCEAIQGCVAFHAIDLSQPDALAEGGFPEMAGYDLILFTEVLQVLCVHPQALFAGLLQRLAVDGSLYVTTANFLSAASRAVMSAGDNPAAHYPPGQENWDRHHVYRHYTGKELVSLLSAAGAEPSGFYYSACLEVGAEPAAVDQRGTLVAVARRLPPVLEALAPEDQEVLIHIGSDKAGSTAIQAHVYGNRHWLREQGIYVPECFLGKGNGHAGLLEELTEGKLETLLAELRDRGRGYRRIFLSWEGAHFLEEPELRLLARYLAPRRVRVMFYLREQGEVIQSGLLQEIKSQKRTVHLREQALNLVCPDNRDYYQTLKRWERCFDKLVAEVVYYDRSAFPEGNVVKDLLRRLGCEQQAGFTFFTRDINTSLDVASALAVEKKMAEASRSELSVPDTPVPDTEHRFFIDSVLLYQKLRGAGERYFLNREQVAQLRAHYQACNEQLIAEYKVSPKLLSDEKSVHSAAEDHFSADIDAAVDSVLLGVESLASHPVCFGGLVRGSALQPYLAQGWAAEQEGGYWSSAGNSLIRLRPLLANLSPCHHWLVIRVEGNYHPAAPQPSSVSINGELLGEFRLGHDRISLPLDRLPADLHVDLLLDYGSGFEGPAFQLLALGVNPREVL